MSTNRRRLRALLVDMEAQGVTFQRDGDSVTVSGMTTDAWLRGWLERHRRDLLAILGKPERSKRDELDDLFHKITI